MKRRDQDRLLDEIFTVEDLQHLRNKSLGRALRCLKRRRLIRSGCVLTVLPALLAIITWLIVAPRHTMLTFEKPQATGLNSTLTAGPAPVQVKFINDEQLLALFPNRSVALVGKPGRQQLIFLDEPKGGSGEKM